MNNMYWYIDDGDTGQAPWGKLMVAASGHLEEGRRRPDFLDNRAKEIVSIEVWTERWHRVCRSDGIEQRRTKNSRRLWDVTFWGWRQKRPHSPRFDLPLSWGHKRIRRKQERINQPAAATSDLAIDTRGKIFALSHALTTGRSRRPSSTAGNTTARKHGRRDERGTTQRTW